MSKFSTLIQQSTPVLVDVYADWCGPCKMLAPTIQDVKNEFGNKLNVIKVDIDKNQSFASKHNIQGVPTLLLYKEGEIVWRQSGVLSKSQLVNTIQNYI